MVAPPVQTGDIVGGKYAVIRPLGKGGMGFVVAARHTTLDQIVAIKFLVRSFGEKDESANRFLREARAAAKITSDYVCKVFDTGTLANGVPYFVMELLDGIDLEQEIDDRGRLPLEEAVDFMMQALDAISTAHKLGIVHRDLKPANLFLTERADGTRRLKVFDFGISKTDDLEIELTDTQGIIGTPAYMSPEQARNAKRADHRTDIFSLGAILFEALTSRPPHLGDSVGEILDSVMHKKPAELAELRPDLPPDLVAAVMRALEPERDDRFASAHEFARALAPYASPAFANLGQSVPVPAPSLRVVDSARPTASNRETVAGWTQGGLREFYTRGRGYLVFGVGALLLSAAVWIAMARSRARESAADAPSTSTDVVLAAQASRSAISRDDVDLLDASAKNALASASASSSAVATQTATTTPAPSSSGADSEATAAQPPSAPATSPSQRPGQHVQKNAGSSPHDLQRGPNKGNPLLDNRE